jgi:hypothetical protein
MSIGIYAETILDEIAEKQGWNLETKLDLCLEYIQNQGSNDAFEDFLKDRAGEESDPGVCGEDAECAGCNGDECGNAADYYDDVDNEEP